MGDINSNMIKSAYQLIESNQIVRHENIFEYFRHAGSSETIIASGIQKCTYFHFCDKAICKHMLAACILADVKLPGLKKKVFLFNIFNLT